MVQSTPPPMSCIDFKDYHKRKQSVHTHINIVLLDKTTNPLRPTLYQINSPDRLSFHDGAFTELGEVASVDPERKIVALVNENIVSYQHMVTATGPKSSWMHPIPDKEFLAGIHVLMEALRLQKSKPQGLKQAQPSDKIKNASSTSHSEEIFPKPTTPKRSLSVERSLKRVYQVQL